MQHKTALVTGANAGIGLALTRKLLKEGYRVIGTSRSGKIDQIQDENLIVLTLDLTDQQQIEQAHRAVAEQVKQIDLFINNAGVGFDLGTYEPEIKSFQDTFAVNVTGLVFFTEPLLKLIPKGGQIINISSKMGSIELCTGADSVAYRMSKAALNMYSKILANRLASKSITVLTLHPGWVQTNISKDNSMAPMTTQDSATEIYKIISGRKANGSYWNAATQDALPW
jgi:NAD(P)-dependent dehydrogenase (short-subunit alcohol dehydrogenase family)